MVCFNLPASWYILPALLRVKSLNHMYSILLDESIVLKSLGSPLLFRLFASKNSPYGPKSNAGIILKCLSGIEALKFCLTSRTFYIGVHFK